METSFRCGGARESLVPTCNLAIADANYCQAQSTLTPYVVVLPLFILIRQKLEANYHYVCTTGGAISIVSSALAAASFVISPQCYDLLPQSLTYVDPSCRQLESLQLVYLELS